MRLPFLSRVKAVSATLRYRLDNFFTKGLPAQFTVLLVLQLGIVLLGTVGLALGMYRAENKDVASIGHKFGEGFWDAAWWSLMHVFDPSYVSSDYGATWPLVLLALAISLGGYVLFGGVIGLVSASVDRQLSALTSGNRGVVETAHILILGWNEKIFSILDLFEDYHRPVTVVILANHEIADMQEKLRTERVNPKRVKPVLRSGSPTNLGELERVAFAQAHSIIVLADESRLDPEEDPDLLTVKTVMLLGKHAPTGPQRPKMVAEILRREHLEVAQIAGRHAVSFICSGEILSRMIVQASRQPGLAYVYGQLFGFADNEIYVEAHPECAGRQFGDVMHAFPNAVPMGTSSVEEVDGRPFYHQHMNPGMDHLVGEKEWLILIAHGEHTGYSGFDRRGVPKPVDVVETPGQAEHVLVLGWNANIFTILRECDSFLEPGSEITVAAAHSPEKAVTRINEELNPPLKHARVSYVQTDYAVAERLDKVLNHAVTRCIILADESNRQLHPDERTIVTLLLLENYRERHPTRKLDQVVAEVLSPANAELLREHSHTDTIISPLLISMLLAQVSQQLMLERVYADLMNAHANEIYLKPVTRYTPNPVGSSFADVMRGAARLGELAIGVKRRADATNPDARYGIQLNPPKDDPLMLIDDDEVIVISSGGRRAPPHPLRAAPAVKVPHGSRLSLPAPSLPGARATLFAWHRGSN